MELAIFEPAIVARLEITGQTGNCGQTGNRRIVKRAIVKSANGQLSNRGKELGILGCGFGEPLICGTGNIHTGNRWQMGNLWQTGNRRIGKQAIVEPKIVGKWAIFERAFVERANVVEPEIVGSKWAIVEPKIVGKWAAIVEPKIVGTWAIVKPKIVGKWAAIVEPKIVGKWEIIKPKIVSKWAAIVEPETFEK